MNKIYKLVWNNVRGCYVVASEFAKSNSRTMGKAVLGAVAAVSLLVGANCVYAAGSVADGSEGAIIKGYDVKATGNLSTAIGQYTEALGSHSTAMGLATTASGYYSIAMGRDTKASGDKSTAMGEDTTASGNWSIAMGKGTIASGDMSTAMGENTTASGNWSIAMGKGTRASGNMSTAMGEGTTASGYASTAMGEGTTAASKDSIAMGFNTTASGDYSIAMGEGSTASGKGSTAWGHNTQAVGKYSTAFGENSIAYGDYSIAALGGTTGKEGVTTYYDDNGRSSIAIGEGARAEKDTTYAIGYNAIATAEDTIALGNYASARHNNSIALGAYSSTFKDNSIDVGYRQITSVKDGTSDYDAVNLRQLKVKADKSYVDTELGKKANAADVYTKTETDSKLDTKADKTYVDDEVAKVNTEVAKKADKTYVDREIRYDDDKAALALGGTSVAGADYAVAIGEGAKADVNAFRGLAVGKNAKVTMSDAIAIGSDAAASNQYALAIGTSAQAKENDSVALGTSALASGKSSVAIGGAAIAKGNKSVAIGEGSATSDSDYMVVSFGNADSSTYRRLTNVADGKNDHDAVNVAQLNDAIAAAGAVKVDGQNIVKGADGAINLSDSVQATLGQVANKADKSYVDTELGKKANAADVAAELAKKANAADVATELAKKANAADVYTKTEADSKLAAKANAADVYTKTEADDKMVDTFEFGSKHIYGILEEHQADINSLLGKSVLGGNSLEVGKGLAVDYDEDKQTYTVAIKDSIDDTFHFAKGTADVTGKAVDINANGVVASKTSGGIAYKTELTENGLSITQNDKGVNITAAGIDMGGNKIANVAAGTAATDAVNKEQLDAEAARAQAAEKVNADAIAAEATRAKAAEKVNADAIAAEVTRAQAAEKVNADAISAEVTRAQTVESTINSNLTTANNRIEKNRTDIETLFNSKLFKDIEIKFDETGVLKGEYDQSTNTYTIKTKENIGDTLSFADNTSVGDNGVDIGTSGFSAHRVDSNEVGYVTKVDFDGVIIGKGEKRVTINAEGMDLGGGTITGVSAVGSDNIVSTNAQKNSIAVGHSNEVSSEKSIAAGYNNEIHAKNSTAVGNENKVYGEMSTAVGYKNKVYGNKSGAFGDPNTITISADSSYVIGNDNIVAGSKIFVLGNYVEVAADISNSIVLGDRSTVNESNVVSVGAPGKERKIVNVADPENPTDAVNLRTLEAKLGNTEALDAISNRVNRLDGKINRTGAHAAALAALRPADFDGKLSVAAGLGNYHGSQAGAIGLFYKPTDRISFNLGGTMGGKENMANLGISFALDRVVPHSTNSRAELNKKLQALSAENAEIKADNAAMKAHIAKQDAKMAELEALVKTLVAKQ